MQEVIYPSLPPDVQALDAPCATQFNYSEEITVTVSFSVRCYFIAVEFLTLVEASSYLESSNSGGSVIVTQQGFNRFIERSIKAMAHF